MDFNKVYEQYYRKLFAFAFQLSFSKAQSDDLVQETFTKFYLEIQKGKEFTNCKSWLYKVLLNEFKSELRKGKTFTEKVAVEIKNGSETSYSENYEEQEKIRVVNKLMNSLVPTDREIICLYNEGLKYAEIAEIMNINANSVGQTLARAIQKLKNTLKIHCHEMFE